MNDRSETGDEWLPHPEATALQKAACKSMGTGQCAAICLSNLAPYGPRGCPEAHRVWKASAIWKEKQRRPSDGPLDQWTWSALANLGWSETYAEYPCKNCGVDRGPGHPDGYPDDRLCLECSKKVLK